MPDKFTIELDARELATVYQSLRWWVHESCEWPDEPMTDEEIDDLAERINAASAPKVTA